MRKILDQKWFQTLLQIVSIIILLEWAVFPALTAQSTTLNIVGIVLCILLVGAIGFQVLEELNKKK